MKKLLLFAALLVSMTCFSQELENILKVDGQTFNIPTEDKKTITLTKDRYGNWNLLAEIKSGSQSIAFNIVSNQEKLASGEYPLMSRVKRIDAGKVAFSVNITDSKAGALAFLKMKQFTSIDKGMAIVKNENGVYSISLIGVEAISIKRANFILSGNISLDSLASKSRKERNKDNKALNMNNAFVNESIYFTSQSKKLSINIKLYNEDNSSENLKTLKDNIENMMDSNDEILNIISRTNDASMTDAQINSDKAIANKNTEVLKDLKKQIKSNNLSKLLEGLEYYFSK